MRGEPVLLPLAQDEIPPVVGAPHRAQEELQHRRIDDLGAVVEDVPFSVDEVVVLPHPVWIVPRRDRGGRRRLWPPADALGAGAVDFARPPRPPSPPGGGP